jgi:magnesium transporter
MEQFAEMKFSVIGYDPVGYWNREAANLAELSELRNPAGITWINVTGLSNHIGLKQLAEMFQIHPLTLEDILNTEQRPKSEEFDDYLFCSMKILSMNNEVPQFEQISFVVKNDNTLISFQENPNALYQSIFRKVTNNNSRVRKMGVDFLAYEIMDIIVDSYFEVLDNMGSVIEEFELRAMDESDKQFMTDLQKTKQSLMQIRRAIWPLRENISFIIRLEDSFISDELDPFFKDLQDNVLQIIETIETNRELLEGILDVNLSAISNRMNKIMKVLTIVSTIFIPLTFIAGVYGMNFRNMPELEFEYAYPICIGVMLLIALGMIFLFKKKKWI